MKLHSKLKQHLHHEEVEVEPYFISGLLTGIDQEMKEVQFFLATLRNQIFFMEMLASTRTMTRFSFAT